MILLGAFVSPWTSLHQKHGARMLEITCLLHKASHKKNLKNVGDVYFIEHVKSRFVLLRMTILTTIPQTLISRVPQTNKQRKKSFIKDFFLIIIRSNFLGRKCKVKHFSGLDPRRY